MKSVESLTYYYSLKSNIFGVCLFFGFVAFQYATGDEYLSPRANAILLGSLTLVFLALEIDFLKKVISGKAAIILNESGVFVEALCTVTIPWEEIENIELVGSKKYRLIGVFLKNKEKYVKQLKPIPFFVRGYYKTPFIVSTQYIPVSDHKLMSKLLEYHQSKQKA